MIRAAFFSLLLAHPIAAHPAWGIIINRAGEVYFSDLETVWRIDARGNLSVARPGFEGRHVHELGIDQQGNIYGPDFDGTTTRIWKMDPSRRITYVPNIGVWRDSHGNTYVVEENQHVRHETFVRRKNPAGQVSIFAGHRYGFADGTGINAQFMHINGTFITADDTMYVTDEGAIRRISPQGVVTTLAKSLDRIDPHTREPFSYGTLFGIAVTPSKVVYVADFKNRRILKLENNKLTVALRAEPPWSPTGVAVANNGDIYSLEFGFQPPSTWLKPRVRRLSASGKITTVAIIH